MMIKYCRFLLIKKKKKKKVILVCFKNPHYIPMCGCGTHTHIYIPSAH